jgi:hypothetical protein
MKHRRCLVSMAVTLFATSFFVPTAAANEGSIAIDCEGITWTFAKFPEGLSSVTMHFSYNGAGETITADIEGPQDSFFQETPAALAASSFHVEASAEWEIDEGAGSAGPVEADLTCGEQKAKEEEKPKKQEEQPALAGGGPSASPPSQNLPFTGFPAWAWLVLGLGLAGSGIGLRLMAREAASVDSD